jgi:branched-chain amino acid transport system ATP-binding protein
MALLEVRNLDAGYGKGPDILKGISLEVEAGKSYCIIGPNGAGKSTLLKVISGLLHPRSGEIAFRDVPFNRARPDQVLAEGICFVPQEQAVFAEMSVKENLTIGAYLERNRSVIKGRMERVFELFPILAERASLDAGKLSGGQQQMLALGRALMIDPEVMLLDEPSLGLAPQIADQIFSTIKELEELGITIVMVEQNAVRGLELADWGIVLDLGIVRFEGPADTILEDPRIRQLYLGKAVTTEETQ